MFGDKDIEICNDSNINTNSLSNFGNCYKLPNGLSWNTEEAKNYLAGSYYFKVI